MTVAVVNGFVCTSSCDVAKAKNGEDPHPLTGAAEIAAEKEKKASDPFTVEDPAVVFGGALATPLRTEAVGPIAETNAAGLVARRISGMVVDLRI